MNIFYLDEDPSLCAQYHTDKHIRKMILEYAQLLSTAHRVLDGHKVIETTKTGRKITRYVFNDSRDYYFYKSTHINHPSAKWTRETIANYIWLYYLWIKLLDEYTYRFGKTHATSQLIEVLRHPPKSIQFGSLTKIPCAMNRKYVVFEDSVSNYRNYYSNEKQHLHRYTNRQKPNWINDYRKEVSK